LKPVLLPESAAATRSDGFGVANAGVSAAKDAWWFKSFGKQGSEQFRVAHGISFDAGNR